MREIKFKRAYFSNEDKTGFLGYEMWGVNIDESVFTAPTNKSNSMSFIDYQYTGLKDKNRKEIHEGDLCVFDYEQRKKRIYRIDYFPYQFCGFTLNCINDKRIKLVNLYACSKIEIIGNIHENKYLL